MQLLRVGRIYYFYPQQVHRKNVWGSAIHKWVGEKILNREYYYRAAIESYIEDQSAETILFWRPRINQKIMMN